MSDHKNTLHRDKLEAFKTWLDSKGIKHRPGKGNYQVLQVETKRDGWQCVFDKDSETSEHYSVNRALMQTVRQFIRETRRSAPTSADVYVHSKAEIAAALEGLLLVIHRRDYDGTFFIDGDIEIAFEHAEAMLETRNADL